MKSIIICLAAIFCNMISPPALMAGQKGGAQPAGSAKTESVAEVAKDPANPLAPITTFFTRFRVELGNGPNDDTNYQLRLQPSFFKPFADQSALLL